MYGKREGEREGAGLLMYVYWDGGWEGAGEGASEAPIRRHCTGQAKHVVEQHVNRVRIYAS